MSVPFFQLDTVTDILHMYDRKEEERFFTPSTIPLRSGNIFSGFNAEQDRKLQKYTEEFNRMGAALHHFPGNELDKELKRCDHARQFEDIFLNKGGLKLANIFGAFSLATPGSVLDIGGGPGGFASYIREKSRGNCRYVGITLDMKGFTWDPSLQSFVDGRYMDILEQEVDFGERYQHIYSDLGNVSETVQSSHATHKLVSKSIDIMHRHIEPNGIFICKIFDITTKRTLDTVFSLSRSFSHWCVFKPFTSRAMNGEVYFVGQGYQITPEEDILLPADFMASIVLMCEKRLQTFKEFRNKKVPVYDTAALPIYWNFP
jgi:23S rRNA U2552 (ribose-2'-O)-methylase RlmE/FtsJ